MSVADAIVDEAGLDPGRVIHLDLASEDLRRNFIVELAQWAKRPPFYAVHDGSVQVVCGRYDDALEVYRDRERFSVEVPRRPGFEAFDKFMGVETLTQLDGARHDRLRRLMSTPFGGAAMSGLRDDIAAAVEALLDAIATRGGVFDAQADLGQHLMPKVLLDIMFRMDEAQQDAFREMSRVIPLATRIPPGGAYPDEYRQAFTRSRAVINALIDERRARPGTDFISTLIAIEDEGDRLSRNELYDQIFTITAAALQSTASSLVAVLWVLGRRPEQFDQVKADLALVPQAIEEALRYHGPGFLSFPRFATLNTQVGGTTIRKGMVVRLSTQAANLDPTQYPNPLEVDIHRKPQGTLVFGAGLHHCLGRILARLVLKLTVERLLARLPGLRLVDPDFTPTYRGQVSETQIASLPMRFD